MLTGMMRWTFSSAPCGFTSKSPSFLMMAMEDLRWRTRENIRSHFRDTRARGSPEPCRGATAQLLFGLRIPQGSLRKRSGSMDCRNRPFARMWLLLVVRRAFLFFLCPGEPLPVSFIKLKHCVHERVKQL